MEVCLTMKITFNIIVILALGFNGLLNLSLGKEVVGLLWLVLTILYMMLSKLDELGRR